MEGGVLIKTVCLVSTFMLSCERVVRMMGLAPLSYFWLFLTLSACTCLISRVLFCCYVVCV